MHCVICGKSIVFDAPVEDRSARKPRTVFDPNYLKQSPYCPTPATCGDEWRSRQPHLFKVELPSSLPSLSSPGENLLIIALRSGTGDMLEDKGFAALEGVSKNVRGSAIPTKLKDFHKQVSHFDKQTPDGVGILADQMLEIAILAYHGALAVKAQGQPIILYRVADKGALTLDEKLQTLSGRIRVKIPTGSDDKEVWPLEKTAAWIQGAIRARANFLLLSDPRGDLKGGKDGRSDAVYVRELHQILNTHYDIDKALPDELTGKMRAESKVAFILRPKAGTVSEPIPLIPKMSKQMSATGAWDGSKSSLTLSDAPGLIRDSLRQRFQVASIDLGGIPLYG
jgi:hypothetical protein